MTFQQLFEIVMHYLLFIPAFIWLAVTAPAKVTASVLLALILIATIVKITATFFVGESTFSASFKSIALSFVFLGMAFATLLGFSQWTGINGITGLSGVSIFGGLLAAYILGFKIGLGISFIASSVVAMASTLISGGLFYALQSILE